MRCGIACQLARLGCECSTLSKGRSMQARLLPQFLDRSRRNSAGVGTGKPHTTPCVIVVQGRELEDAATYPMHVSAVNKPQTPSQTLVEDVASMFRKTRSGKT